MSTETRRNIGVNPRAVNAGSWLSNGAGSWTNTVNTAITGHPLNIVTACKVVPLAPVIDTQRTLASSYSMDGLGNSTIIRGVGLWVWATVDTNATVYLSGDFAGTSKITPVPANTWTWVTCAATGFGSAIVQLIKPVGQTVGAADYALLTGCVVEVNSIPTSFYDGDTPNTSAFSYEWVGTVGASASFELSLVIGTRRNKVIDPHLITASGWGGSVITGGAITGTQVYSPNFLSVPGEVWTVSCDCIAPAGSAFSGTLAMSPTTGAAFGSNTRVPTNFNVPAGTTQRISNTFTVNVGADGFRMLLNGMSPIDGTAKIDRILIEKTGLVRSYFDGNTPYADDGAVRYYWAGTANNSESVEETAVILRRNKALNPISPVGTSIALWAPVRGTAALNGDSLRLTINDATVALAAARITPSAGITTIAVKPNTTYTISSDFRTNSAAGGAITTQFYDSGSVIIGSLIFTVTPALNSSTFVRGSHTFTTPPNTAYVLINIGTGNGPRNIGEWYDFRQVLIEESAFAQTYFDGNTTPANGINYYWLGAVNNSESVATGNSTGGSKGDTIYSDLLAGGYGPGSMADMEYKRLLAKNSLIAPQKLTLSDLYSLAGERPRIGAFRK
jgi:hypothetical protein